MNPYSLEHLSDETLDRELVASGLKEVAKTAVVLATIAESEARGRYAVAGYPSMVAYCMAKLPQICDTVAAAFNRIHAAHAAREHPAIFPMVADGRLSLTAVNLLAPRLTAANAEELLNAAAGKTKTEVLALLAARYPKPDLPTIIQHIPASLSDNHSFQNESGHLVIPVIPPAPIPRPRVTPLSAERVALQVTVALSIHDKMRRIRALRSHQDPSGDMERLLDWMCDLALDHLEKRKYGATDKPRATRTRRRDGRYIPAAVRRAVHERDGDRCTYVSPDGHQCEACSLLQFDHIVPVPRGGESTVANLRLRCRTHNQFAAEQIYGAEFMEAKREQAKAKVASEERGRTATSRPDPERDVTPWLRSLGVRPADAKRAEEHVASMTEATLEDRVKAALAFLAPPHRKIAAA